MLVAIGLLLAAVAGYHRNKMCLFSVGSTYPGQYKELKWCKHSTANSSITDVIINQIK